MAMQMLCSCGTRLTVQGGQPGQEVVCVSCGQSLRIPAPPQPRVQATRAAEPQVRAQAPRQAIVEAAPAYRAAPRPRGGSSWPTALGFVAMLAAVGGVYYVMGERVKKLEQALDVTADEVVENAKESKALLADEQKRASDSEAALGAAVAKQEQQQQSLEADLAKATQAASALRSKMDADVARHDAELEQARKRGDDTAALVQAHEQHMASLRGELKGALGQQSAIRSRLDAVTMELDGMKQAFLAAAIANAKLAADVKLGDDALRSSLDAQQQKVDRLTARLGGATGVKQIKIRNELRKAQDDLVALQAKVAAGPPPDPDLVRVKNRLAMLQRQLAARSAGSGPARSIAAGFSAATSTAHVISVDSRSGRSEVTSLAPSGITQLTVLEDPREPADAGEPGRFDVREAVGPTGAIEEFVRLDTTTGQIWILQVGGRMQWRSILVLRPPSGPTAGSFRLDLLDARAAATTPSIPPPPGLRGKRILVLTDLTTGRTFTDWSTPRLIVQ